MRRRLILFTIPVVVLLIALVAGLLVRGGSRHAPAEDRTAIERSDAADTPGPSNPLTFAVDPSLRAEIDAVDAIEGSDVVRPVGVYAPAGGSVAELVVDEVIVHAKNHAELDGFLARWDGTVLDSFAPEADGSGQDHLVRVDASRADPSKLADDLRAYEPDHAGQHRVSDEATLRLLALAASEWRRGTELVIDWLTEPQSIEYGEAFEAGDISKNVFEWSYMQSGGALDIGVGAAWQLLDLHDKLHKTLKFMVGDGGFQPNPDFPRDNEMHKADWGDTNAKSCTSGSSCPWHGTDVTLAGIGQVDNGYGTAGPGGPVADALVAVHNSYDYWTQLRRLESIAEDKHPHVVNLSFTREVNVGRSHARYWTDRRMRHIQDAGPLVVAAAGNNGKTVDGDSLIVPCESSYVMCVGGFDGAGVRASGSNYGEGDSPTSVEIYGPMCVRALNDPGNPDDKTTKSTCGTSVASPFVGGIAMLVKAADPSLSPQEIRAILNETANAGGLGSEVTGSQRRVNALKAVAKALGVDVVDPTVTIETPAASDDFGVTDWIDLMGSAVDFAGRELEIVWTSDKDGEIGVGNWTGVEALSEGTHLITATATDSTGRTGSDTVTVEVADTPPDVAVVSPHNGLEVYAGTDVPLVATSLDPDTWSPVDDGATAWEVRKSGSVVFSGSGHQTTLPATKVSAGTYTVTFTAADVSAERSFTVVNPPPGMTPPQATITTPNKAIAISAYNGQPMAVDFAGTGTDAEDGSITGTRYRWVAHSQHETKVLCEGSNVPKEGKGDIVQLKDCSSFEGELGLANGDVNTTVWTVWLEVYDSTGLTATDTVTVTVKYITG